MVLKSGVVPANQPKERLIRVSVRENKGVFFCINSQRSVQFANLRFLFSLPLGTKKYLINSANDLGKVILLGNSLLIPLGLLLRTQRTHGIT